MLVTVLLIYVIGKLFSKDIVSNDDSRPRDTFGTSISEEIVSIYTYPFSHETVVPQLLRDSRIYPYTSFLEYSSTGINQNWKVVKLENELISVYILPGVGGKVWYAEVTQNPRDFVYKNGVLKFRGIGIRGPWTSGGIEFNFGVVGHTPSASSDVNYRLLKNDDDGSVSCVIGSFDLPSRTFWRVEIRLDPGAARFETKSTWYNPTPMRQSYYSWMNSATKTSDDMQLYYHGNKYLGHPGESHSWPIDSHGRDLSIYRNNNFGGSKSYHIVGEYQNIFGAYYHKEGAGFCHFSDYDSMPGKKAFMWSLSGSGKIWERLLTDSSGQYLEMQAGRLLNQYMPHLSSTSTNSIKRMFFEPYLLDSWVDVWVPVENIGGISTMSKDAVMYVEVKSGGVDVSVHSFKDVKDVKILVKQDGVTKYDKTIDFVALEVFKDSVVLSSSKNLEVELKDLDLHWSNVPSESPQISRPFETLDPQAMKQIPDFENKLMQARDYNIGRYFPQAINLYDQILTTNPWNKEALIDRAELYFRGGEYDKGLQTINKVLQINTYLAEANYLAGILYRAKNKFVDAKECFGIAARSMSHRSTALAQRSEIEIQLGNPTKSILYAQSALEFHSNSIPALQTLSIAARLNQDKQLADSTLAKLLTIDPLNHFARFEMYIWDPEKLKDFEEMIRNENSEEIYLELSLLYRSRGQKSVAVEILQLASKRYQNALIELWLAYLTFEEKNNIEKFEFHIQNAQMFSQNENIPNPFRRESIEMLEFIDTKTPSWKWKYMLSLLYWSKCRYDEASELMNEIAEEADQASFYVARSNLLQQQWSIDPEKDLLKALSFSGSTNWEIWSYLISYYQSKLEWGKSLNQTSEAYQKFSAVPDISLYHVRSLIHNGLAEEAISVLHKTIVLPTESNHDSRTLWEWSYALSGIEKVQNKSYSECVAGLEAGYSWPEYVGVGKPYFPDERMFDILMWFSYKKMGEEAKMVKYYLKIVNYTQEVSLSGNAVSFSGVGRMEDFYAYVVLMALGEIQKAEELITNVQKSGNGVDEQWVVACAKKDVVKLGELKEEYKSVFDAFSFQLFEESLRVVASGDEKNDEICLLF